ncbi:MAG: TonB family protein [Exilibacterium sp.]
MQLINTVNKSTKEKGLNFPMKTHICNPLVLCLFLSFFGVFALADPTLNGLAVHQELGKERFIAALYAEHTTSNPATLLNSTEKRRMELRVTTNRYSARRMSSMWIEGMAVNNSAAALTQHAQNMVNFTHMIKRKLVAGDILTIESAPDKGTHVSINGVKLGTFEGVGFFNMLLRSWIGSVPLSSDFRNALLRNGKVDNSLLARYEATTPSAKRIASVESWLTSQETPDTPKTDTEIASSPDHTPEPNLKPVAPIAAALPKPQLPEATQKKSIAGKSAPEDKAKFKSKPKTKKAVKLAVALPPPPDEEIVDIDELEEEEDAPVFTAESLLSRQLYHSKLLKWTYQYLKYPQRAQKRGQEGSVRLAVVIDRSGNIKKVSVVEESRYALLNKEAQGAVNRANPFPPMPEDMSGESFSFSLPIEFRMN